MLLKYIIQIIIFRKIIKLLFANYDYHTLFRSFFCLFISSFSFIASIYNWDKLLTNPFESNYLSLIINNLMISYMLIDTGYFLFKQNYRMELIFHHVICIGFYGFYNDTGILSFCAGCEILSAFNWVGIIFPNLEWTSKLFRLYSILFIRLFIWVYTLVFLSNIKNIFLLAIGFGGVSCFILLDIYWTWIIIKNYFKYKNYIGCKIIKKKNKLIRKIKNSKKNN